MYTHIIPYKTILAAVGRPKPKQGAKTKDQVVWRITTHLADGQSNKGQQRTTTIGHKKTAKNRRAPP